MDEGAQVSVDGENIADNGTAMAQDGKIVFSAWAKDGYEITSVLVDGEKDARHNGDSTTEYIIEGIKTDETVVSVSTQALETETPETEAPGMEDIPAEGKIVTFQVAEGAAVTVDGENIPDGGTAMAKDGTIVFFAFPKEGYEITSVIFDGDHETRKTSDESGNEYIIEGIQTDETVVSVSAQPVDDGIRRNVVTFEVAKGAVVTVDGENVADGETAMAKDGTIIFTAVPEDGYEITSVIFDGDHETRKTDNESGNEYILEGIQTDETVINVSAQGPEDEETETETEPGAAKNEVSFNVEEGLTVTLNGEDVTNKTVETGKKKIIFEVEPEEGYEIGEVVAEADGEEAEVTETGNGEYTIKGLAATRETLVKVASAPSDIAPISIKGPTEVEVGDTITLTSDVRNGSNHKWTSSDDAKATVEGKSYWFGTTIYIGEVTGIEPGTVTITHTYTTGNEQNQQTHTETYEVTVVAAKPKIRSATFYIRLDGTVPNEPAGNSTSKYTSGATVNNAYDRNDLVWNGGMRARYSASGIGRYLKAWPSEEQLRGILNGKTITLADGTEETITDFSFDKYEIVWYVLKEQSPYNQWNPDTHVDGIIRKKSENYVTLTYDMGRAEYFEVSNTPDPMSQQYLKDTKVTVSGNTPEWPGHTFKGWATKPDGPVEYKPNNTFIITENTILYAIWDEVTTEVTVTKKWVDGNSSDRPSSVQVWLLQDGKNYGDRVTLTAGGNWTHTWENLPETDDSGELKHVYSINELAVEGYKSTTEGNAEAGFIITNKLTDIDKKINVTGTKTWVDGGKGHNNAEEVKLTLSQKSAKADSTSETMTDATVTWEGNTYTFENLPKYDAEGYEYTYSVTEAKVDGYTTEQTGNNFTNTISDIDAKTRVTGTKTWVDGGKPHDNEAEVKLTLSRKSAKAGSEVESVEVTATWEGDTYTFSELPKYDAEGYAYTYSVAETAIDGYTTEQVGNNFTNTMDGIDAKIVVTGTKTWVDGGKKHDNADELTLTLSRKSAKAGSTAETVTDAIATWIDNTYTFANLPKYDAEGYEYTYSVAEAKVEGYTTKQVGNDFTNTVSTINDEISVTGTKTWVDGGKEHDNATELTLTLSRTSAKAGSTAETVTDATATWVDNIYTFANLPKYDAEGYEYTYSVAEAAVEGYTTEKVGNNFTNTMSNIGEKISVSGTKTWVDGGKSHNNAEELTLTLSRTSAKAGSKAEMVEGVTATWDGNIYTFADVAKYDAEGYEYTYRVAEAEVDGYTTEQTGNNFTNTMSNINEKTSVTGTKTWVDGGKEHNNAEELTLTLSRTSANPNGGSTPETVEGATVTWDGNTYTFKDVAKYDAEGYEYTYSVTEVAVENYTMTSDGNNLTNTKDDINTKIDITGTKTWVDGGQEHDNAKELTLTLSRTSTKKDSEAEPVEATATWDGNTYKFESLPKYDAEGYEYTYNVAEAAVIGYTTKQDVNNFTNTVDTINDKIDVTGTKTWVDGGKEHNNATELTLTLKRTSAKEGSAEETVEATATWAGNTYTFADVAKYDAEGYEYTYSVTETAVGGYNTKQEGYDFTNTADTINDKIDVSGTKTWVDGGKPHDNAKELTLTLNRISTKEGSATETVKAEVTWEGNTYTFKDVAKYDAEGYAYTYSVSEDAVEGYTTTSDGNDFTNTINTINDKINVSGTKTWVDGGKEHNNAEELMLTLSRKSAKAGAEAETVEGVTATWSGDTYAFENVAKYDADGYEYTYSVTEAKVEGYTTTSDGNNFTNTMDGIDAKIDVSGTKTWVDGGQEHDNAKELTLTLSRTSAKAGSEAEPVEAEVTWSGDTYTFAGVDKYDKDGYEYTYSVAEAEVEGYTTEQIGNNFTNTMDDIDAKIVVTGTKTWVDGGKEHNNAKELTLTLSRTSAKGDSEAELVEATATWEGNTYTFKDVAKYDAGGYEYTYSVAEAKVDGYTMTSEGNNFTNTIEQDSTVSVSGTKTWIDPEGSEHPEVTIQLLRDNNAYKTTTLVDDAYSFTGLDKYDLTDGHEYKYTVKELEVSGYTSVQNGTNFTNTIKQDNTVSVSGAKTWIDPEGSVHPEVTIQLLRDGEKYKTTTLVDDAYSFTGLDKYDLSDGHVYEYTVEELEVEGYTSVKNGTNFTNTIAQDSTVEVSGTKTWIDPKGSKHPEVTIQLLRDGEEYKTTQLVDDAYSFTGLDKYDLSDGHVYEYTVEELEVEGYTSVKNGTNFTNTIEQDSTVSVSGTKTWIDPEGSEHPEVTIQLLRDGEAYKTTTLVNDAYSFTGLDKYDLSDGHVYEYTVEELEVEGYTSVKNGTNFTNTIEQDSTVEVSGTKTWIDPEGSEHPEVTIQLLRDGEPAGTTTLVDDAYSFTNLDKYDLKDGHVYEYTVEELGVEGYTSEKVGDYDFKNTIKQDSTVEVSGTKTWIDPEGSEHPEVTIQLLRDGEPAGTTTLVDDAYSFTGLDKYDLSNGHVYKYTVKELAVPGYTTTQEGNNFTNTIVQDSTVEVSGTKTWIDPEGSEHPEVTIQLLRDGEPAGTTTLVDDAYSFTGLDKYDLTDGHVYEYTVEELEVEGYTSKKIGSYDFRNTIAQDSTVSVSGTKTWIDPEGSEHPEVTIQLLRDGKPAGMTTLVDDAYSFTGLDKYDLSDGHVYEYTVEELEVEGYTSVQDGTNFTNTIKQDSTVSVSGTKTWIDPEGSVHPEVTIQLLRDGEPAGTTTLVDDAYSFTGLDKYDLTDGHVYEYTVEELEVPGYTSVKNGTNFTNTIAQDSTVSVSGTKTWIDPEGSEHPEVTIQLLRDGKPAGTTTLVDDAYSFTGLDKYDLTDGHVYEYTVEELEVEGYTSVKNGTNFTNTIEQDSTVSVSGTKTWIDPEGSEHPEVTIQLLRDGEPAGTTTLVDDAYSFTGLDKYDLSDGHVYEYTVKELPVSGYTSKQDGTNFTNTIAQDNTVSVSGTKTWIDPEGSEHPEVTIQLLRDGEAYKTTTLENDAYSFTELDKYDLSDGHVYEYTVEELEVEGYTSVQNGTNFTNTIEQDSTVSVSGTKTWIDPEGSEHPEVTIQLLRDGKEYETTTLVDDAYSFTGLDKYDLSDGHVYEYTVEELNVPNYTSVQDEDGTNFTNTMDDDEPDGHKTRGEVAAENKVTVTLADGTIRELLTVGAEITYTIDYYNHTNKAADITITDTLPNGTEFVEASDKGVYENGTVTWTISNVGPFERGSVTVTIRITEEVLDGESTDPDVTNKADIQVGDEPKTEVSSTPDHVAKPAMTASKALTNAGTGDGGKFKAGETAEFDITVTNSGNTTQTNVIVSEQLADAVIVEDEGYTINEAGQAVIAEMAPGAVVIVKATYTVKQSDIDSNVKLKNVALVDGDNGTKPDPEPEIPIPEEDQNKSLFAVKTVTNAPAEGFKAGETAEFDITVTNTGNTTQKNVTVTEQLADAVIVEGKGYAINEAGQAVIAEMAPNDVVVVKATYTVKQEDIDSDEKLKNIAKIGGGDPTDPVPDPEVEIPKEPKEPNLSAIKTVTNMPEGGFKAGEKAEFNIAVTNTGNTTQKNVTVTEQLSGAVIVEGEGYTINEAGQAVIKSLAPNDTVNVKAEYTVKQEDIDSDASLKNIAHVGPEDGPDPEVDIPEEPKNPGLTAEKSVTNAPEGGFKAGETAEFDITVRNSGNTTQTGVTVSEQLAGAEIVEGEGYAINEAGQAVIAEMAPNDVVVVKAKYTVKQEDIDSNAELKNVALVEGDNGTNPDPEPEIPIPEEEKNPGLTAEKSVTNAPEGGFKAGETAEFDITIRNSGNTTQTGVTVSEQLAGAEIVEGEGYAIDEAGQAVIAEMAPNDVVVVKAKYTVKQEDIDSNAELKNVALVKGDNGTNPDPEPEIPIPEEKMDSHLTIIKTTTSTPANNEAYVLGETITYSITAMNDGNLTLTDVTVTDELTGDSWTIKSLKPGASENFAAEYVVTEADILEGSVKNVATATGTSPDPDKPEVPVEPGNTDDPTEPKDGHLTITKTTTSTPKNGTAYALGETIAYKITAENDGNLTITDITVTDELTGDSWTIESLEPEASETFTASHVVTEADILAGSVLNVATATGTSPDPDEPDVPVEPGDTEDPTEPKDGHVTITKTTTSTPENGTAYGLGETITYEITATNDGNLTLTDVVVTDELTGDEWTIESLAPEASETFTAEYVVTEADILAGSVLNVAAATGTSPDPDEPEVPVEPGDTEDPTEPKDGHLTITKTTTSTPEPNEDGTPKTTYALGETITYEITAENDGNLTLTDVVVTDELTGDEWTIESLEPGASETFTARYVVTEADVLAGSVLNVATATGTSPDPEEPDVPVEPGEKEDPTDPKEGHLTIAKTATSTPENGTAYGLGETITYAITATNDGNLTLTDITVTDELTGDEWTIDGLEPGASETFTAEHVVTEADVLAGSVVNVATATGTSPDPEEPEVPVEPGEKEDPTEPKDGHVTITKTATSTPENGTAYGLGETITYEITATNDGNLTLTDITVTDELTGDEWTIESLEPGASESFTAEHVVTEADILAGSVLNVAAATGTSPDPEEPEVPVTPGEDEEPTQTPAPSLFVRKEAEPREGGYGLGETVTYTIEVTNNGNVTLTDVVVTDPLTGLEENIGTLEPNEEGTITTSYTVTEADILAGEIRNTATAAGMDPDNGEVTDDDDAVVQTVMTNGHLTIAKTATSTPANGEAYVLDETVAYSITATNDGNLTLTDITVTDELTEDAWTVNSLAPGESESFTAEHVVTEADILAGSVVNVATATGTSPDPEEPDVPVTPDEEEVPTEPMNGHLTIAKTTTSTPANGETYAFGETVTYSITATNDGNLTLTDITVTDELTGDAWTVEALEPGASETFTAEYVITEADILAGSVLNVATAAGTSPDPEEPEVPVDPDEEEVPTEPMEGHLTIAKAATSTPANGEAYVLGERVTYSITAINDGNLTLTDITVTDELTGSTWTVDSLAPGTRETFTAEYVITEADILAGSVLNVATATGTSPDPEEPEVPVTPGEEEVPTEPTNGHLTIAKTATSTPANGEAYAPGETITYSIMAVNDGNLTLTDITVTDELTGSTWTVDSLAPGESESFTTEHVATEADVLAGSVLNVATATGTSPDPEEPDVPVTPGEEEVPTEPANGHLTIAKTATSTPENGTAYGSGETITYEITAVNDGNLTLTDITVTDELTGDEWTIESLAPGASESFTAEHVVTEADILAGSVLNVATATGTSPDPEEPEVPVTPGEEEEPTQTPAPSLFVEKTAEPREGGYALGETVTYTIEVTNNGNVTLTDVVVTDPLTGLEENIGTLEPNEEGTITTSYTVTEADILAGEIRNTATAAGMDPDNGEVTDDDDAVVQTVMTNGHLTIAKTATSTPANGEAYVLGETVAYSITATNDGNLTITDITVTDELTGDAWTVDSLAPGESESFTAEHVVTEADVLAGSVVNVAVAEGTSPDPEEPEVPVTPGEEEVPTEPMNGHLTIAKAATSTPTNGEAYVLGETVAYSITATNDGNLTITDITVTDELTGDTWTVGSLAPGESESFTTEHVVTEADVLAGSVVNVAVAEGTSPDPEEPEVPVTPGEEEVLTEPTNGHLTIAKTATSTPANGEAYVLGETVAYSITAMNDGNLTLTNVVVTDELTGGTWTVAGLAPGESESFTTEHVVTEADILAGSVVNVATATGTSPDPEEPEVPVTPGEEEVPVTPGEEEVPTEPMEGHLTIAKTATSTPANGEAYVLGETVTYSITATNDGNLTITDITVTDELTGDTWTVDSLAPGAGETFTTSHVVTEADILAGSVVNVAVAEGTSPDPEEPEVPVTPGEEEVPTEPMEGHLTIAKTTTSTPANGTAYAIGETITYEITAVNDGNLTITDITVTDELTGDTWTVGSLAPGGSQTFTASHVVTEEDAFAGSVLNVAAARGTSPDPEEPEVPVTPGETEDPVETPVPSLYIEKTAEQKEGGYALGDVITYTIRVVNNGNTDVSGITVNDSLTGDTWTVDSLAAGGERTFTAEYTVTEADILAGAVTNTAVTAGTAPDGSEVGSEDSETVVTEVMRSHMTVAKATTSAPTNGTAYTLGETITYEITATNDGNLTVTDITVTDELTGDTWAVNSLAPGAGETFTTSHVVTEADILAGSVVNVAAATGTSPDPEEPEVPVTPGQAEVPTEERNPAISVDKAVLSTPASADGNYAAGETVTYQLTVTNTGNMTLRDITIDDLMTRPGGAQVVPEEFEGIGTLAPGESAVITYDYAVTEADLGGSLVNDVTVEGTPVEMPELQLQDNDSESIQAEDLENSTVTVSKTNVDGLTEELLSLPGAQFYVALFADEQMTQRVGGVQTLAFGEDQATAEAVFENLAPGTYYIAETDEQGNVLTGGEYNGGTFTPEYAGGQQVVVTENGQNVPFAFRNLFAVLPEEGYSRMAELTITKEVRDTSGVPMNSSETFYAGLFADEACTIPAEGVSQQIIPLAMNGGSEASAVAEVTILSDGSDTVVYVAEVTADGTPVKNDADFAYEASVEGGKVTVNMDAPEAAARIINVADEMRTDYYKAGDLTITKEVRNADGKRTNSNETFYAGIFSDSSYTTLADNVSQPVVELNMEGAARMSVSVEVTIPDEESDTILYVTEVTKDGKPVSGSASFAYDMNVTGGTVVMNGDVTEGSVTIVNTAKASADGPEEPGTEEPGTEEPGTEKPDTGNNGTDDKNENKPNTNGDETEGTQNIQSVRTGDETPVMMWMIIFLAAALAMFLTTVSCFRRRRNR